MSQAHAQGTAVEGWDLAALNGVLAYTPEDMTVTVESGMTLSDLQTVLAPHRQWVPLDPPNPANCSLEQLLSENLSGPRRCGYGTVRDHVIGLRAILADGREIHSGGNVVKNVAGYDVHKLLIGARGALGIIVEVTFKLLPLPEAEAFFQLECIDWNEMERRVERVWNSICQPVVFDLFQAGVERRSGCTLVLGFAGAREDVESQSAWAIQEGFRWSPGLTHDDEFLGREGAGAVMEQSVLPSKLVAAARELPDGWLVARVANGLLRYRALTSRVNDLRPLATSVTSSTAKQLSDRVKQGFDPKGILPSIPI